ncbi:dimethyl sulfoxide reductase anchor subunit [Luteimonas sp. SX5]|uniref:Dimethyl sulfoxide reductase anchor subunit n=1 Tax=Luteimonas galliterrae TaxID=2940486 RepID=A0ABT0MJU0_9GAMM|nr:DmsC/YnfH family molybdoenzyme membrane anchor subunit [Luteimonas galliterrae]MCL1634903.1 dimethyl sulfoxide reductase anchor subunit [Luteimonas galliterrae]
MHPALSVIFFTTLSGAGYGLLVWLGISVSMLQTRGSMAPQLASMQLIAAALAIVLVTVGLLCSLGHLGKPQRAWRAMSQWRTSWLSREGVLSLLTYLPAMAMVFLLWRNEKSADAAALLVIVGMVTAMLALATIACTAMIYASLKPIPAWTHPLVLPGYLLFALLGGAALLFLLMLWRLPDAQAAGGLSKILAVLGVLAALLKLLYWRETDRSDPRPARGAAVGLPGREVEVFERPHTEANFITKEMVFVVAREHSRRLRRLALGLFAGVPVLAAVAIALWPKAAAGLFPLTVVCMLAGTFVERWLFFAEAKHVVSRYY